MAKTNNRTKALKGEFEKMLEKAITKVNTPPKEKPQAVKCMYWEFLLYPDCPRHLEYLYDIKHGKYPMATGCLHDKDTAEEIAEIVSCETIAEVSTDTPETEYEFKYKKAHAHIIIRLPYNGTKGTVERMFPNLESHLIIPVDCVDERYRYLIHLDHPSKYQYSPNEVFGNTQNFYNYYHTSTPEYEGAEVCRILDILDNWDINSQGNITYSKVIRICCELGLYGYLRKSGSLLSQVIKEKIQEKWNEINCSQFLDQQYTNAQRQNVIHELTTELRHANEQIAIYKRIKG